MRRDAILATTESDVGHDITGSATSRILLAVELSGLSRPACQACQSPSPTKVMCRMDSKMIDRPRDEMSWLGLYNVIRKSS